MTDWEASPSFAHPPDKDPCLAVFLCAVPDLRSGWIAGNALRRARTAEFGYSPCLWSGFCVILLRFLRLNGALLHSGLFTHSTIRMSDLPHFDDAGHSRMVDVGQKAVTHRIARARGTIQMLAKTQTLIRDCKIQKGEVLEMARVAGIMASKKTAELIPLCHPLRLDSVKVDFDFPDETTIGIVATVTAHERTGVEMEALQAVSIAALTIYDMCKGVDRAMTISNIQLLEKSGGHSGHFKRDTNLEA